MACFLTGYNITEQSWLFLFNVGSGVYLLAGQQWTGADIDWDTIRGHKGQNSDEAGCRDFLVFSRCRGFLVPGSRCRGFLVLECRCRCFLVLGYQCLGICMVIRNGMIVWKHGPNRSFFLYNLIKTQPMRACMKYKQIVGGTIKQFKVEGLSSCFVLNLRMSGEDCLILTGIVPGQLLASHFLEYQHEMTNTI